MARISLGAERIKRQSRRVFYGWWIVGGGFSLQMVVGSLMIHSFTAYFPLLQTQFGWSRALLSGAFALSRAESGILGPLQGWLIDKFGPRMMVRVGMLMFGAGTNSPPNPKPLMAIPIATPRRLSNQLTTVVATVKKPAMLEPAAMRAKVR